MNPNSTKKMNFALLLTALILMPLLHAQDFDMVTKFCDNANIPSLRSEALIKQFQENKISPQSALNILSSVKHSKEKIVLDMVLLKIEEGLAKNIPAKDIIAAAKERRSTVATAVRIMAHHELKHESTEMILRALVSAIESGTDISTLVALLAHAHDNNYSKIQTLIENAESLSLAKIPKNNISDMLIECIDNKLDEDTIKIAVDFTIAKYSKRHDFKLIERMLWNKPDGLLEKRCRIRSRLYNERQMK